MLYDMFRDHKTSPGIPLERFIPSMAGRSLPAAGSSGQSQTLEKIDIARSAHSIDGTQLINIFDAWGESAGKNNKAEQEAQWAAKAAANGSD